MHSHSQPISHSLLLALGALSLNACSPAKDTQVTPQPLSACIAPVDVYGTRASLKADDIVENIKLASLDVSKTMIGYGPSTGYKDELTIIDGIVHIATAVNETDVTLSHDVTNKSGGAFLVTSSPKTWVSIDGITQLENLADLEARLTDAAIKRGCSGETVFPFKVTGRVSSANWSVVGRPEGAKSSLASQQVVIVGIFAKDTADIYFMPKERLVHPHVHAINTPITAHLNEFSDLKDAIVYIGTF